MYYTNFYFYKNLILIIIFCLMEKLNLFFDYNLFIVSKFWVDISSLKSSATT